VLTQKYYEGVIPAAGEFNDIDTETLRQITELTEKIEQSLERYRFREAQQELMNMARLGNKYLADEEPWKLIKTDPERVKTVMYVALQIATALAVASEPFLPFTSEKLKRMLQLGAITWENLKTNATELLKAGHRIGTAELLFEKIEDVAIEKQLQRLENTKLANKQEAQANTEVTVAPQKELISYDDFAKMDIRIGTILEAEKMPKAAVNVHGKTLLYWALERARASGIAERLVVTVPPDCAHRCPQLLTDAAEFDALVTEGGNTRTASVIAALDALAAKNPSIERVLIHDCCSRPPAPKNRSGMAEPW